MLKPVRVEPPKHAALKRVIVAVLALGMGSACIVLDFASAGHRRGRLAVGAVMAVLWVLIPGHFDEAYAWPSATSEGCIAATGWVALAIVFLLALIMYTY